VYLKRYYEHIVRGLIISRESLDGSWAVARMGGVHLQCVALTHAGGLFFVPALLCSLTTQYPGYLYKVNKRLRAKYLAGSRASLRGPAAFAFLSILVHLVLFNAVNFRGFFLSRQVNPTTTFLLDKVSFYHGAQRAFDNELLGLSDNSLKFVVQLCLRGESSGAFVLRSFQLPIHYKGSH
jgi:hypothetical protein